MVKIQKVIIIGTFLRSPITLEIVSLYGDIITSSGMISVAVGKMDILRYVKTPLSCLSVLNFDECHDESVAEVVEVNTASYIDSAELE